MAARRKPAKKAKEPVEIDPSKFNLLPCPFCGEPPDMYLMAEMGLVRCEGCGVKMQVVGGLKVAEVMWNTRESNNG